MNNLIEIRIPDFSVKVVSGSHEANILYYDGFQSVSEAIAKINFY